ncbi:venom carboxylesterase-6-like [Arctopsyche grandis]|uniref:venom carboxylesterase-6-like n=1 Tax=Arctopsyche grandis TaxID=121162 RepID=UPI00406D7002
MTNMYRLASLFLVIFVLVQGQIVEQQDDVRLEIDQGKLAGHWKKSLNGRKYAAFEGIPFAKPPVGDRRFKEPKPAKPWQGVLQAKNLSRVCIQWYHIPGDDYNSIVGDEDCLYLNVYSPNLSAKLPVIVYIHGGAFIFGTGVTYQPTFIMDKDVVYVNINYRLGPLGFMSTQDEVVPGNNGMKDQVMALKWVKDNIRSFGGDPDSITIMGMSAGGASVHYHMLSPLSKGLFHRGISQSGTVCCPWTLQTRPLEKAQFIGNQLGCPTKSSKKMIECLRNRPAASIVATVKLFMPFLHSPFSPFAPVIEPSKTDGGFLTEHPYHRIRKGATQDVPWLNSLTTQEGLYPVAVFLENRKNIEELNSKWTELVPHLYDFNDTLPAEEHKNAADIIKKHYFGDQDISIDTIQSLIDSISDRHFVVDVEKCVRRQASVNKKPVYLYQFAYSGEESLGKFLSHSNENYGVSHGDDTGYCLDAEYMDTTKTVQDRKMIEFMITMISTFAKHGNPDVGTLEWLPVDSKSDEINYLEIKGPNKQTMKKFNNRSVNDLWKSLFLSENENFEAKCTTCRDDL